MGILWASVFVFVLLILLVYYSIAKGLEFLNRLLSAVALAFLLLFVVSAYFLLVVEIIKRLQEIV